MTETEGEFYTFHLSGGTTEALLYRSGELSILGQTLDLNAGQAVDRVGVMLGMHFPCGEELEALAEGMPPSKGVKISVKGDMAPMLQTRVIDGREYLVIPVSGEIEVNGIQIVPTQKTE
jgi:tRNA A37 threonylcarbamoyltransferase TsaD